MKKILVVLFLFTYYLNSFAQKNILIIDSIKGVLKKELNDSIKGEKFFRIASLYRSINKDSSLFYVNISEKIALENKNLGLLGKSYNLKGSLNYDISNHKEALKYFYKSKKITSDLNSYRGLGIVYNKLAIVHRQLYNLDSALFYNYKTLKVFDSLKILPYSLHAKNNIANILNQLGNKKEALKQHESILKIRDSIKDYRGMMQSLGNIGDTYGDLGYFNKAIDSYEKGIEIAKSIDDSVSLARFYNNQASLLTDNNKLKEALKLFKKALKLREDNNDLYGVSSTSYNIASILLMTNQPRLAEKNLQKSISIAKKYELTDQLQEGYDLLSRVKLLVKQNDSSFFYQRLSTNLLDSISKQEYSKSLAELEAKYESEKKEKQLLQTRTEKAETELKLSKTKTWTFVLIGGIAILLFLGFAIFQRNKRKHQLAIASQKEKSLQSIVLAEEKERARIARELHDGVVQQIGSIILKSRNLLFKKDPINEEESQQLLESLENSNKDLRNISHQMMPIALKELGIIPALQDLLDGSLALLNIKYSLEHFNIDQRLPEKIEVTIYRITQELINNIIKHSKATDVSLQLLNTNNNIILIVEDNGVGFSKGDKKKGIGLLNISSRLDLVKGAVNFEPSPKSGTLVTIKIPL
ncbi:tetratricopeptide repeat-containing sensor histidine kinase [Polaribacter sp.]|uniref:tetratricopeptide repeat-containing sensor histidine kinase n=1 Tax=Polaribacter sp. TaxID=1920175 RepID=UPI003F6BE28C